MTDTDNRNLTEIVTAHEARIETLKQKVEELETINRRLENAIENLRDEMRVQEEKR